MPFLPPGYKEPKNNRYLNPGKETISFRILGNHEDGGLITGWELWVKTEDGFKKPVRIPTDGEFSQQVLKAADVDDEGVRREPKLFWAMKVMNRDNNRVEILNITQKSIRESLLALTENKKWGEVTRYDITITSAGDGLLRKYTVTPEPPTQLEVDEKKLAVEINKINLQALYVSKENPYGGDPFAPSEDEVDISDIPF